MILLIVITVTLFAYLYVRRFGAFKRRNIPHVPFSLNKMLRSRTEHPYKNAQDAYDRIKPKSPIGGLFFGLNPFFIVTDLGLAKRILIKDFDHFVDRGIFYNSKDDPVGASMFVIEGDKWKSIRQKITPTFSSGKIKEMLPVVLKVSDSLNKIMVEDSKDPEWDIKNILCRFTVDVIGSISFGLDCNGLTDPNNEFLRVGMSATEAIHELTLPAMLKYEFTKLARILSMKRLPDDVAKFYERVATETINYREKHQVHKEDFIGAMIKLKNQGGPDRLTVQDIVAQSYSFFVAGFETSANTLNYSFYNLAIHPDLQNEARIEALEVLSRHDNKLTYDSVQEMHVIHKVVLESLRRYPSDALLFRNCTKDYQVPDTNIFIKKGERVVIPVQAMQLDDEIYPDAQDFNINRDYKSLLSFGQGQRACPAERFAMVELKLVIANFLKDFEIVATKDTPRTLEFSTSTNVLATEQLLYLRINKL